MRHLATLLFLLISFISYSQTVVGKWKTIDDETGKEKSIVEIYEKEGQLFGRVLSLFRAPDEVQDPVCDLCEDDRKGKRVIGMDIIRNMVQDDDEWTDGTICDPKNGKIYDCKFWLDPDDPSTLYVRGYILFFYRTQTWTKVP